MNRGEILVIEDDFEMALVLRKGLELENYSVTVSSSGDDGLRTAQEKSFQAIVLDVMLPGLDGYRVAATLRGYHDLTPILMLSARDAVEDVVRGLDCGVEDYLTKPFSFLELCARLRSLIRRSRHRRRNCAWRTSNSTAHPSRCFAPGSRFGLPEPSFEC
jgi:two-component system OmpR family response regulator